MATGNQPFPGATSGVIFDGILNRQPVEPLRLNPILPVELAHILNKALEKDRTLRHQTASDLRADLDRHQRSANSGSSRTKRSRVRLMHDRPRLRTLATRLMPVATT